MITINTNLFREVAIYFNKHGRYPDGIHDSYEYHEFWDQEMDRCLNGYKVGDMYISGYHYFYLNYWPIWLTRTVEERTYGEVFKNRRHGSREFDFPDFWDVDWLFFTELHKAEQAGQHFLVLKPRGTGFSYKGSGMCGRNFFCIPGSKSYMLADTSEFLLGDGLFTKWLEGRMFVNKPHPEFKDKYLNAFGKPSDFKKDRNEMHYIASTNVDGEEKGYMSQVMGVSVAGNTDKARGKRGKIVLLEEMGAFRKVEQVFNVARSSVEEGDITYGTILGFGTGGSAASVFGDMEKMFYNPEAYNIRCFDNIWDEGMRGTKCAFFTPDYRNIAYKDEKGNSLEKEAKDYRDHERVLAAKSSDANAIIQLKAEHPYTPQEAILRTTSSVLPSNEAREWYHAVIAQGMHKIGVPGELKHDGKGIIFRPNLDLKPIHEYPHDIKKDLTGCVVQYYSPYRIEGKVPDNLYIIALDPYAFDQSTDGQSIGAAYVYMQPNNLVPPGDRIVATYFGRPKTTDDFNRVLFMLAELYNAKIGFENDRGDTIGYAKRFRKLDWLADEFELAFDADISKSKVRRNFGMHIGSGKENVRMHKGNKYLSDWLQTPRGKFEDETERWNLHTIFCPATLKEIDLYRLEGGNFDRISALRILAYYMKELVYKDQKPEVQLAESGNSFWNRRHFL